MKQALRGPDKNHHHRTAAQGAQTDQTVDNQTYPSLLSKPVLVAGASGFVGSHIARQLRAQGRQLRLLLRKSSKLDALRDLNAEIVYGDVLDPASLRTAMAGCGSVFYSVLDPRFWLTDATPLYRNNVEGLRNAIDAALECGVQRFIFTSTMGTLGFNPDGAVTEDIPFNWRDKASPYILTRLEAETQLLAACRERGLPGVALCIANTYGPQDFQPTPHGQMLADVAFGRARHVLDSSQPTVDVRDAAQAALLAEQYGRAGERYIIANEYVSQEQFCALACAAGGGKPPKRIPLRTAYVIAWVVERLFKLVDRKDSLLSTDSVFLSNAFGRMDHGKASRELHWQPRPLAETIRDAVAWYASQHPAT